MQQGKIEVVIRQAVSEEQIQNDIQQTKINNQESPEKPSMQKQAINTALINAGKQMLQNGISQYGNITGDYVTADKINSFIGIAGDALTIATGGLVGIAAVSTKYAISGINAAIQQRKADYTQQQLYERSGNAALGGSRYD